MLVTEVPIFVSKHVPVDLIVHIWRKGMIAIVFPTGKIVCVDAVKLICRDLEKGQRAVDSSLNMWREYFKVVIGTYLKVDLSCYY